MSTRDMLLPEATRVAAEISAYVLRHLLPSIAKWDDKEECERELALIVTKADLYQAGLRDAKAIVDSFEVLNEEISDDAELKTNAIIRRACSAIDDRCKLVREV